MSARPATVDWPGGIVSFTFDDFPKSALATGGGILERYGARGTYYAAMGLAGTDGILGPMFEHRDIGAAHRAGHELACHTYSHLECRGASKSSIPGQIRDNATALAALVENFVPTSFAYPYGTVSVIGKRLLGPCFSSCRGIRRGINHPIADLAELRATALYAGQFDDAATRRLIDRTVSVGGWLIFFTHDVCETPSPYGCTAAQLEAAVAYAAERAAILPVRGVVGKLVAGRRRPQALAARCRFAFEEIKNLRDAESARDGG